jgi:monothiol glutaredoxin
MGIIDRLKRRLPILGAPSSPRPPERPAARAPVRVVEEEPPAPVAPRRDAPVADWIDAQVKGHPVVLFMKGSPSSPLCGFSANAAGILSGYGVPLHHVDVILDPDVREGVKTYTSWPTLPQVFVGGEFVGGSDILRELHDSGELKDLIAKASASAG